MTKIFRLCLWIGLFLLLNQCGRSKDDDGGSGTPDVRVPAGWDGKSDYTGSAFTITTAK